MGLLDDWKARRAAKAFQRTALGQELASHSRRYLYGDFESLTELSEHTKQDHISTLYRQVAEIVDAENPLLAMRERLSEYVLGYAQLTVLTLTESDKEDTWYAASPGVSAKLYRYIDELWPHHDQLKELQWRNDNQLSDAELVSFANVQGAIWLYYVGGLDRVRTLGFNDSIPEKDWLRPFLLAMMIYSEDCYRQAIDLPTLLWSKVDGMAYSTFLNRVVEGHKNPYYEWEQGWKEYADGSPEKQEPLAFQARGQ